MAAPDADRLAAYIASVTSAEPPELTAARSWTWRHRLYPRMATGHTRGRLLKLLAAMIAPRRALEIGTYTACSTLCLAEGMPAGAVLHTIEIDDESEPAIRRHLDASAHGAKVRLHIGDALDLIPRLETELRPLDMAYIDGNKRCYCDYLALLLPLMRPGGWIIADNTLWDGKAADPDAHDAQTLGIRAFNACVAAHPGLEAAVVADGDGLSVIRVKEPPAAG